LLPLLLSELLLYLLEFLLYLLELLLYLLELLLYILELLLYLLELLLYLLELLLYHYYVVSDKQLVIVTILHSTFAELIKPYLLKLLLIKEKTFVSKYAERFTQADAYFSSMTERMNFVSCMTFMEIFMWILAKEQQEPQSQPLLNVKNQMTHVRDLQKDTAFMKEICWEIFQIL
jgi:hypothetical protein